RGPLPTSLIARGRRPAIALALSAMVLVGLAPAVVAADTLAVTTPYPAIAVAPGSSASFDLTITAPREGTADLTVSGTPSGWTATLHGGCFVVSGVSVASGKPATARLDVKVPGDTTVTDGRMVVTAKLGGDTATLPITVSVSTEVAGDITLDTANPILTGPNDTNFSFDLTLTNGSAQDQTVSATATGPAGWTITTKLSEAQAASTVVKAGSSTTITVSATPPTDAPAGQTVLGDYQITFTASAPGENGTNAATDDLAMTFTVETSPIWLLAGFGLIVAIVVALFYVFRTYGRR